MLRPTLFIACLSLPFAAQAMDAKLTWTRPTTFEDGAPMAASQITEYRIEFKNLDTGAIGKKTAKGTLTGYTITGLVGTRYEFRIKTVALGRESAWSNTVTKDKAVPPCDCVCPPIS